MRVDRQAPVPVQDAADVAPELDRKRAVESERVTCGLQLRRRGMRPDPAGRRIARDDPGDHERQEDHARHDEQPEGDSASEEGDHPAGFRS